MTLVGRVRLPRFWDALPWALGAAALLAVVIFDFGPPLAFNDDWGQAWSTQHLDWTGIHNFPTQSALAIPQEVFAKVFTFGFAEEPWLRLTILPFILLTAWASYRLARMLGADRMWSGLAGIALLTTPIYLNLATSFMTDVPYIGLMMAATYTGARWVRDGEARVQCVTWAVLAMLQRQIALAIPLALTLALLARHRTTRLNRKDSLLLVGLWVIDVGIEVLHLVLGAASPVEQIAMSQATDITLLWRSVGYLPATLGFALVPFALALALQVRRRAHGAALLVGTLAIALGIIGAVAGWQHVQAGESILPGNIWTASGFVPTLPLDGKPRIFGPPIETTVEVLAAATFGLLLLVRWKIWPDFSLANFSGFLVILAAIEAAITVTAFVYDRYYFVSAALLVPLLASVASRARMQRLAVGWGLVSAVAGIALYMAGQQDYEAWQEARDRAARAVYRVVPANMVFAGYEAQVVYWGIPTYEANPSINPQVLASLFVMGPSSTPQVYLLYASPEDTHPGVPYSSLAPGKIIVYGNFAPGKQPDFSP